MTELELEGEIIIRMTGEKNKWTKRGNSERNKNNKAERDGKKVRGKIYGQ